MIEESFLKEENENLKNALKNCLAYFEHDASQPYLHDEPSYSAWAAESYRLFSIAFETSFKILNSNVEVQG